MNEAHGKIELDEAHGRIELNRSQSNPDVDGSL
jgi:hypothetical protein